MRAGMGAPRPPPFCSPALTPRSYRWTGKTGILLADLGSARPSSGSCESPSPPMCAGRRYNLSVLEPLPRIASRGTIVSGRRSPVASLTALTSTGLECHAWIRGARGWRTLRCGEVFVTSLPCHVREQGKAVDGVELGSVDSSLTALQRWVNSRRASAAHAVAVMTSSSWLKVGICSGGQRSVCPPLIFHTIWVSSARIVSGVSLVSRSEVMCCISCRGQCSISALPCTRLAAHWGSVSRWSGVVGTAGAEIEPLRRFAGDGFSRIVPSGAGSRSALREAPVSAPCGFAVIAASQAAL